MSWSEYPLGLQIFLLTLTSICGSCAVSFIACWCVRRWDLGLPADSSGVGGKEAVPKSSVLPDCEDPGQEGMAVSDCSVTVSDVWSSRPDASINERKQGHQGCMFVSLRYGGVFSKGRGEGGGPGGDGGDGGGGGD
jgi:hypothetical protein